MSRPTRPHAPRRALRRATALVVAASLLALAACAPGSEAATPAGGTPVHTLTVWIDEDRAEPFATLLATYTEQTGVPVEVVGQQSDVLRAAFLSSLSAQKRPDVVVGAHDWLGELMADGSVLDVDLPDPAAFTSAALGAVTYEGDVYGVPLSTENIALVRNDGLTSLVPTTFDEMVEEGERLVGIGAAERPLLLQQGATGDPYHLYPVQTSFGAPVFATDETGSYTADLALGGEGGHAAAEYIAGLGRRGVLDPELTGDAARDEFAAGAAPFVLTGPWNVPAFVEAGLDVTVLPVPPAGPERAQPFVGVQVAFVSRTVRHEPTAEELLAWLASHEVQVALYKATGRAPALQSAVDAISDDPVVRGFAEAGQDGAPMPAIPQMSAVWASWGVAQRRLVADPSADPSAVWDAMVNGIARAIATEES